MEFPSSKKKSGSKGNKASAKDLPGSGKARKSGDDIEKRKSKNRSALDIARKYTK